MKSKFIIIMILFAILIINPTKNKDILNFIDNNDINIDNIKKIDINDEYKSTIYDNKVVYYDDKSVRGVDLQGKDIFKIDINSNDNILESNKYIDILDKENSIIYSINKNGKILFKKSVPRDGILYKSLREDLYVYVYKQNTKNILNIYDNEYTLVNSIELEGAITDINLFNSYIYVVELNTNEYIGSNIYKYDYNGNLKGSKIIEKSVVLGLENKEDSMLLVTNNSVGNMDSKLNVKNNKDIKNIKYYSNMYNNTIYAIDENNNIKLISDKEKKLNLKDMEPKGIINNGDSSIFYDDNKLVTANNKEIKSYDNVIESIYYIGDNKYLVNLDRYIELIEIN